MGSAARVTSAAEGLPRRRFTVAEVEAMVAAGVMEEDERVELIGGELVPMSPKGNHHETAKIALVDHWNRARPKNCTVAQETTFRLSEDTYLKPGVVIYPRGTGVAALTAAAVLLVVEIAEFLARYELAGRRPLAEVWHSRALGHRRGSTHHELSSKRPRPTATATLATSLHPTGWLRFFAPEAFALRLDELGPVVSSFRHSSKRRWEHGDPPPW